ADARRQGNQRIAKRVHENHAVLVQAFCKSGPDVVLRHVFHQRVLGQNRERGEFAYHVAEHRQEHVARLLNHFLSEAEIVPVVWTESAEWKYTPETAAAEQHQQRGAERPARHRIAEKHDEAAEEIELGAVSHGLHDTERNTHEITEEKSCEPERDR